MEQDKKIHNVIKAEQGYFCTVCHAIRQTEEELKDKECGGLPPLGFGVGDKAPQRDKFGG